MDVVAFQADATNGKGYLQVGELIKKHSLHPPNVDFRKLGFATVSIERHSTTVWTRLQWICSQESDLIEYGGVTPSQHGPCCP
ncbi:hypothetical protein UPYG_G00171550 [Umbra pygmaea]|uniref:Uncharacterized protein n=1 Tax=Umbra pygmaea TaxID=75934 RepID=A0ABD0WQA8_UMBPY